MCQLNLKDKKSLTGLSKWQLITPGYENYVETWLLCGLDITPYQRLYETTLISLGPNSKSRVPLEFGLKIKSFSLVQIERYWYLHISVNGSNSADLFVVVLIFDIWISPWFSFDVLRSLHLISPLLQSIKHSGEPSPSVLEAILIPRIRKCTPKSFPTPISQRAQKHIVHFIPNNVLLLFITHEKYFLWDNETCEGV